MEEKKNEVITLRTTEKTKKILQEEAKKIGWTTGKLAEKIISDWTSKTDKTGGSISFIIQNNEIININGEIK